MQLVLQIFLQRKWSLEIIRICHKNHFWGSNVVLKICILRYKVRHNSTLSCSLVIFRSSSTIFELLINIGYPLISIKPVLCIIRSHHLYNVIFVDRDRPHNDRSHRRGLVIGKGNLLFGLSFKNLLLLEIIAVHIAALMTLCWIRQLWNLLLGRMLNIIIVNPSNLLVVHLLVAVSLE